MPKLEFETDWVDAEGINGPELSATWASLQIRAGDSVITRVLDTRAETVRDFVYVPLYPLAEWLVTNWWFLTHEFENRNKKGDLDFHRRHGLGPNREGYAFPDLEVVSSGAWTRIGWRSGPSPWTKVEFLGWGETRIESREFREVCADFVDLVIRRLVARGIEDTFLQEEWTAIQSADEEEIRFCETAAGLGWDPYDLDEDGRDLVLLLAEKLGDVLDEAIPALDESNLAQDCSAIASALSEAKALPLERLRSLREKVRCNVEAAGVSPWETGYQWAQGLRQALNLDGQPLQTMANMADALHEDPGALNTVTEPVSLIGATLIDGMVTHSDNGNPAFAFRQRGDYGRRFHFCRALAEVLMQPGSKTLLTKAHSERQQRNRAFAAEFLAPSSGLRQMVSRPVLDDDDVDELAVEFGVHSRVVEHQIKNHHIARII